MSGGLDSSLAVKILKDLGVDIYGVYFSMPWGCCNKTKALALARKCDIKFMVFQLDETYLDLVRRPKHGYGTAMNPCVDCRVHMFSRARQYMEAIGADFVFTGEVLGQRPMSQMRPRMKIVEKESGLTGRLLRPLCAGLLEPTIVEQKGLIDRERLLSLSGRSRKVQMELAERHGIDHYLTPAGGCLLTDKNFARKMEDVFRHGYRNFRETIILKWGRHFRISEGFKAIVGRNHEENEILKSHAHRDDHVVELKSLNGPTLILKGADPTDDVLKTAGALVQRFSRYRDEPRVEVHVRSVKDENTKRVIRAERLSQIQVDRMRI